MPAPRKQKRPRDLTVAVTGPTGTFGSGLVPLLEADDRVERVVGVARSPFDPAGRGWSKMDYRQGDVRDEAALRGAFEDADVVVHLAFLITGTASRATVRSINVDGTLNAFRAAAEAGAERFVYASSIAAYGFHPDNPVPMDERWPARPARRLFYSQEKAELEERLLAEAEDHPDTALYMLRPPVVLGPNAAGGKVALPGLLEPVGRALAAGVRRLPFALPIPFPDVEMQVIHEDDVGRALMQCVLAAGDPGVYNIAADGTVRSADLVRALGLRPVAPPEDLTRRAARLASRVPAVPLAPPAAEWVEALAHPAIMDTRKAQHELHFTPEHSAQETVQTLSSPG